MLDVKSLNLTQKTILTFGTSLGLKTRGFSTPYCTSNTTNECCLNNGGREKLGSLGRRVFAHSNGYGKHATDRAHSVFESTMLFLFSSSPLAVMSTWIKCRQNSYHRNHGQSRLDIFIFVLH